VDKASSLLEPEETVDETAGPPNTSYRAPLRPIESGVFPGARAKVNDDSLVGSLQGALTAASRGEAGLTSLHRSLRDASRALTASRHAHQALTEELREMYRALTEMSAEKAAVERYAALLTQERDAALDAAEEARREAKRDRDFLVREQDRFIQLIVEEHEAEVERLKDELARGRGESLRAEPRSIDRGVSAFADGSATSYSHGGVTPYTAARLARVELMRGDNPNEGRSISGEYRVASDDGMGELELEGRRSSYPPGPGVIDLDALAYEVAGNSERPPPIRRMEVEVSDTHLELRPSRVPDISEALTPTIGDDPGPERKD
jgi:hypothetical protein